MNKVFSLFNMVVWAKLRQGFELHGEMYYDEDSGKMFMYDQFSEVWRAVATPKSKHPNTPLIKVLKRGLRK